MEEEKQRINQELWLADEKPQGKELREIDKKVNELTEADEK